jgi:hypothetical protein
MFHYIKLQHAQNNHKTRKKERTRWGKKMANNPATAAVAKAGAAGEKVICLQCVPVCGHKS